MTDDVQRSPGWSDWRWQIANAITTVEALKDWINVTPDEEKAIAATSARYRWRITPYYASIMDPVDPRCPVRLQAIPHLDEIRPNVYAELDPVGDMHYRRTARLIHKYPDRVAILVSSTCPVYCRHCTRKYHTTDKTGTYYGEDRSSSFEPDLEYIRRRPQIRDVLLTGGDPLMLPTRRLEQLIEKLRDIPHIELIRIGSRFPVLLPQRVDAELVSMLARYKPLYFITHFNHSKEITAEAVSACHSLADNGIPVLNQTVLLAGINDQRDELLMLFRQLGKHRVLPYYLYHCDDVNGVSHFVCTIASGRQLMEGLWGHTTGFVLPRYILTTHLGKLPLWPGQLTTTADGYELSSHTGGHIVVSERGTRVASSPMSWPGMPFEGTRG
ncbi:KamA family radical SAM protein [Bradyrhizobium sp. SZCCHNR1015]|uniref:KamA family radical SAM protein n=1 Tax=Bradyrhizobium sp. SZCCHNR1015 TaxID=3057338 RepID=UPI002915C522|nr:KamA family radical SAM protein [Bradyrhizobium sp. SZCCHNR1015]